MTVIVYMAQWIAARLEVEAVVSRRRHAGHSETVPRPMPQHGSSSKGKR